MEHIKINGQLCEDGVVLNAQTLARAIKDYQKQNVTLCGVTVGARRFYEFLRLWKKDTLTFRPEKASTQELQIGSVSYKETMASSKYVKDITVLAIRQYQDDRHKTRIRNGAWVRKDRPVAAIVVSDTKEQ